MLGSEHFLAREARDWARSSLFCVDAERWKPLRGPQLDLDPAPAGVVRFITRAVAQNVLVAQLRAYLFGDVRQLANVLYFKSTATGQFPSLHSAERAHSVPLAFGCGNPMGQRCRQNTVGYPPIAPAA